MNTIRVTNLISRIRQGSKKATVMVPLRLTVRVTYYKVL